MNLKRRTKIEKVINNRQKGVVVLENISDPHNAAAVWRTCDAFGIQEVWIIDSNKIKPKKIGKKTSSSANKWLGFRIFEDTIECVKELKREKYRIIGTALTDKAIDISRSKLTESKIALVFGNEHSGLSDEFLEKCDEIVMIPMRGMVQSLNISVSAGIFLYELDRQRRKLGKEFFQLELKEKTKLIERFGKE